MTRRSSIRFCLLVATLGLCTGCFAPLLGGAATGTSATSSAVAAGGTTASSVVSNPSILDMTAKSTRLGYMSPAGLLAGNPSLEGYIIAEQCAFNTPDPMFLVPDGDQQRKWMFVGRLNQDHDFNALEYRSILTLGLMKGTVQLSAWPVELVSLSDMPQLFLEQRLPLLPQAKMSDADSRELEQTYLQQEAHIQRVVGRLETGFNPLVDCARR